MVCKTLILKMKMKGLAQDGTQKECNTLIYYGTWVSYNCIEIQLYRIELPHCCNPSQTYSILTSSEIYSCRVKINWNKVICWTMGRRRDGSSKWKEPRLLGTRNEYRPNHPTGTPRTSSLKCIDRSNFFKLSYNFEMEGDTPEKHGIKSLDP